MKALELASRTWPRRVGRVLAALALVIGPAGAFAQAPQPPAPLPTPLPLFPPDNWWNVDVSSAPVDPNSANFISATFPGINPGVSLHPDFGGSDGTPNGIYGMVYVAVPGTQALEPVTMPSFSALLPLVKSQGQPKIEVSQISLSSTRCRSPPLTQTPAAPTSWMRQPFTAESEE